MINSLCRIVIGLLFFYFSVFNSSVYANPVLSESNGFDSDSNYREIAHKYQQQADYYNALAGIYESSVSSLPLQYDSESKIKEYNPFIGSQLGFGGGSATGSGDNTNFSGSLILNYDPSESESGWNFNVIGQYDYLYTPGSTKQKNRLYLQQNSAYMFDKYNGTFAQASYLNDVSDGYIYVYNQNIGYQLQLLKDKTNTLAVNFGPGAQERQASGTSFTETQPQFLSQLTYNLNLSDILTFYEQLQNTYTSANVATYSISQLNLLVASGFSIGLNYQITHNSQPSDGASPVVTITSFQVNYGIN